MNIILNGEPKTIESDLTVSKLLEQLGLEHGHVAVAINRQCILRNTFAHSNLSENDSVEILSPMAGG